MMNTSTGLDSSLITHHWSWGRHEKTDRFQTRGVAGGGRALVRRPRVQRADPAGADEGRGARLHGLRVRELRALERRRALGARHPRVVGGAEGHLARRLAA